MLKYVLKYCGYLIEQNTAAFTLNLKFTLDKCITFI